MKFSHTLLLIPFLLIFFSCVSEICEARVDVVIGNGLGENTTLTLHCKSRDDDLGVHSLINNQTYSFHFEYNFFLTTQFFCSFHWDQSGIHWYDIVHPQHREYYECNPCLYLINAYGPCFLDSFTNEYDDCRSWNID